MFQALTNHGSLWMIALTYYYDLEKITIIASLFTVFQVISSPKRLVALAPTVCYYLLIND